MNKEKLIKKKQLEQALHSLIAIVLIVLLLLGLQSCSSERKALKPYVKVATDTDTSYTSKKRELISRVCAVNFPIEIKTIVKDSIVNKVVKVQDKTEINRLKNLLAKGCPTINIDSIYEALPLDTLIVERWRIKETTVTDSNKLFRINSVLDITRNDLNKANAAILIEQSKTNIAESAAAENKALLSQWKIRFFVLLFLCISFVGLKVLAKYRTLPFKI